MLRHKPDEIGLSLDSKGWANIVELINKTTDFKLSRELIEIVVETSDKQRLAISEDNKRIKANQGHSIEINLDLTATTPPNYLLHGTAERFLASIKAEELKKQNRLHVHLSQSAAVANTVGQHYGKPVLLQVTSKEMHSEGYKFYKTLNNVWLVDEVAAKFIKEL